VSKRRDRPYQAGRSKHWIKVKNRQHPAMSRAMDAFRRGVPSNYAFRIGYDQARQKAKGRPIGKRQISRGIIARGASWRTMSMADDVRLDETLSGSVAAGLTQAALAESRRY
jgi:hypothetical protein